MTYIYLNQIKEELINKLNSFDLLSDILDNKHKAFIMQQITEQEIHKEINGPNLFKLLFKVDVNLMTQFFTLLNIINCFTKQYAYEPKHE